MPFTLNEHITYTRNEWLKQKYYSNVIDYLRNKKIKTIIDAGGCTGEVTKIIFEYIDTVRKSFIFEASKVNSNFIKENLNGYNIEIINKFLFYGKESISIGLSINDNNVGGYSMNHTDNIIEDCVPTTTLESIDIDIDFIKLDIEGAEENVIINSSKIKKIKFLWKKN